MQLYKLGTVPNDTGGFDYVREHNPLLLQGVMSLSPAGVETARMNPNLLASPVAALAIARVVGGRVVVEPGTERFTLKPASTRVWAIQMPDRDEDGVTIPGVTVNAGAICQALGNDVGYSNVYDKCRDICRNLQIPFDASVADRIINELGGM